MSELTAQEIEAKVQRRWLSEEIRSAAYLYAVGEYGRWLRADDAPPLPGSEQ